MVTPLITLVDKSHDSLSVLMLGTIPFDFLVTWRDLWAFGAKYVSRKPLNPKP